MLRIISLFLKALSPIAFTVSGILTKVLYPLYPVSTPFSSIMKFSLSSACISLLRLYNEL